MWTLEAWTNALPLNKGVRILALDAFGLLAFEKPAGTMTHPNKEGHISSGSLLAAPYDLKAEHYTLEDALPGGDKRLFILNRIDSPTSGIVLAAWKEEAAKSVRLAFKSEKVKKTYYAIVKGIPPSAAHLWVDCLKVVRKQGKHVRAQAGGGVLARTQVQLIRPDANKLGLSLLKMYPLTGRTHQLRIQSSLRHCPILGDRTYGDFNFNRHIQKLIGTKRMFLHAAELEVPTPQGSFRVSSLLPESFNKVMDVNPDIKHAFAHPLVQPKNTSRRA